MKQPSICVVGSSNMDIISKVPRLPKMGESLTGHTFHMSCGGKGANQAVMAARLGARVTMVTRIGGDPLGRMILENYRSQGVEMRHIVTDGSLSSGLALILVDEQGRNLLVHIPGANTALTPADVERARKAIQAADVLICQLEVPLETTWRAMQIAREGGGRVFTILNPAPARPLPAELLALCDIVAPNETEAELITGLPVGTPEQIEAAGRRLRELGARRVVITLGERGALRIDADGAAHVPGERVAAVDTTGAGDAFIGSLAYFIARGKPIGEAMRRANAIAAVSVTRVGAQVSFPRAADIPHLLA